MLYIIKNVRNSRYLTPFVDIKELDFSPFESDALKLPQSIAESYVKSINELDSENKFKLKIIPSK